MRSRKKAVHRANGEKGIQRMDRVLSAVCRAVVLMGFVLTLSQVLPAQQLGGSPEAKRIKNPVAPTAASIAAGQASYRKNCRFCHGEEGKGDGKQAPKDSHPADLTDGKWDRGDSDGEIFAVIQNGAGPKFEMKGFKSRITAEETWNLVNYVRSLGPPTKR
jgi:mono/diheme cytochrome c family protein